MEPARPGVKRRRFIAIAGPERRVRACQTSRTPRSAWSSSAGVTTGGTRTSQRRSRRFIREARGFGERAPAARARAMVAIYGIAGPCNIGDLAGRRGQVAFDVGAEHPHTMVPRVTESARLAARAVSERTRSVRASPRCARA